MSLTGGMYVEVDEVETPNDVLKEIDRLKHVGTDDASYEIQQIISTHFPILEGGKKIKPILHSDLFLYAVETLKGMERGPYNIAELINHERTAVRYRGVEGGVFSDRHKVSEATHHIEALKHLLDVDGEDAAYAINEVAQEYPEEAVEYLSKIDNEAGPEWIPSSAFGLDATVLALGKLVDLQEQVEQGVLKNISKFSIQEATRKLASSALDFDFLKEVVKNQRTGVKAKYEGREVKSSLSDLRAAFERVDGTHISQNKYMPLFDKVVKHYNDYFDSEQALSVERDVLLEAQP